MKSLGIYLITIQITTQNTCSVFKALTKEADQPEFKFNFHHQ